MDMDACNDSKWMWECVDSRFFLSFFKKCLYIVPVLCISKHLHWVSLTWPDPTTYAKLPHWQLDCNPQCTSAHAYSFSFSWNVIGWSLEWSYFERMITRTITGLAGDGQCVVASREKKTLSLRVWVLNVRTAGKLGRVCFCMLSTTTQLQSYLPDLPWWLAFPWYWLLRACKGWGTTVLGNNFRRKHFSPAKLHASTRLTGKLCSAVPGGRFILTRTLPLSRFHHSKSCIMLQWNQWNLKAKETWRPRSPPHNCIISQSGTLPTDQKLQKCLRGWAEFLSLFLRIFEEQICFFYQGFCLLRDEVNSPLGNQCLDQ